MSTLSLLKQSREIPPEGVNPIAISLISNFTDGVFASFLCGAARERNFFCKVQTFGYRAHHQVLCGALAENISVNGRVVWIDLNAFRKQELHDMEALRSFVSHIEEFVSVHTEPTIFVLSPASTGSTYSYMETKDPFFSVYYIFTAEIRRIAQKFSHITVLDSTRLALRLNNGHVWDMRGLYAFDMPFSQDFLALVAIECAALFASQAGRVKKCLVLDLDNTLWGGVLGEDGVSGIQLGPDYPGNAFVAFQENIRLLASRGVLLAINSKNNKDDVLLALSSHPHMILRENDFACIFANWEDKVNNLRSIAEELGIGTDALVFLDDDPVQRNWVKEQLPEVSVPDWSMPPEEYSRAFLELPFFHTPHITAEDSAKTAQYREESERKMLLRSMTREEYIESLGIRVRVSVNNNAHVTRVAQLTQKTNQFNMTTRRYTEADILAYMSRGRVYVADIVDRFGVYGVTALCIALPESDSWRIDTFLMSCRVLGRGVEYALLDAIVRDLGRQGVSKITAEWVLTPKNAPARGVYEAYGFAPILASDSLASYELCVLPFVDSNNPSVSPHILVEGLS